MKTNQIIGLAIFGIIGYMLLNKQNQPKPPPWYNPNQVPPMPPPSAPNWMQWANAIISTFGAAAWLWQPGGPFYKIDPKKVYDALPPNDPAKSGWDDPNSLPQQWV